MSRWIVSNILRYERPAKTKKRAIKLAEWAYLSSPIMVVSVHHSSTLHVMMLFLDFFRLQIFRLKSLDTEPQAVGKRTHDALVWAPLRGCGMANQAMGDLKASGTAAHPGTAVCLEKRLLCLDHHRGLRPRSHHLRDLHLIMSTTSAMPKMHNMPWLDVRSPHEGLWAQQVPMWVPGQPELLLVDPVLAGHHGKGVWKWPELLSLPTWRCLAKPFLNWTYPN